MVVRRNKWVRACTALSIAAPVAGFAAHPETQCAPYTLQLPRYTAWQQAYLETLRKPDLPVDPVPSVHMKEGLKPCLQSALTGHFDDGCRVYKGWQRAEEALARVSHADAYYAADIAQLGWRHQTCTWVEDAAEAKAATAHYHRQLEELAAMRKQVRGTIGEQLYIEVTGHTLKADGDAQLALGN